MATIPCKTTGIRAEKRERTFRFSYSMPIRQHVSNAFPAMTDQLDRIDRKILSSLQENGRLSMAELANAVGLSKTPVAARVRRLEKDGYILGYTALVDHDRLGEGHIAFVQVKLSD